MAVHDRHKPLQSEPEVGIRVGSTLRKSDFANTIKENWRSRRDYLPPQLKQYVRRLRMLRMSVLSVATQSVKQAKSRRYAI